METIDYKGYKIEIHRTEYDYANPFEDWDCEFTLMFSGGRYYDKEINYN